MGTFVDPEVIHPHIAMHPADNYYNTDSLGGREGGHHRLWNRCRGAGMSVYVHDCYVTKQGRIRRDGSGVEPSLPPSLTIRVAPGMVQGF